MEIVSAPIAGSHQQDDMSYGALALFSGADVHFRTGLGITDLSGIGISQPGIGYETCLDCETAGWVSTTGDISSGTLSNAEDTSLSKSVKNFLSGEESVGVIVVPKDMVSQDLEVSYDGRPLQMAVGKSVYGIVEDVAPEPWRAETRVGSRTLDLLRPGERPQIVDIKPYHEGIDPFIEYRDQRLAQISAFSTIYGTRPVYRYLLYRLI